MVNMSRPYAIEVEDKLFKQKFVLGNISSHNNQLLLVWLIVENTLDRQEGQLIVFISLAKLKSISMNVGACFLFISCVVLSIKESESCCCTWHVFYDNCGCNAFNCNCDYNGDGYCYYLDLFSGDLHCHNFFWEKCAD